MFKDIDKLMAFVERGVEKALENYADNPSLPSACNVAGVALDLARRMAEVKTLDAAYKNRVAEGGKSNG